MTEYLEDELKKRIEQAGSINKLSQEIGFSRKFISDVLNGHEKMTPRLMGELGYEVKTEIVKKEI
tara:strand:- start:3562 stop:3756 length:195 start_codon:yes stop_codon:yes gene_type:complete